MMESGYMDVMQQYYNDAGLQLLGSFAYTFRQMSSNKPAQTLADLQGLRIRTMENRYHEIYWQAMGATSIPLVFSELYMALSQDTMDAQEEQYLQPGIEQSGRSPEICHLHISCADGQQLCNEQGAV